ncbi:glyoxalase superfamily protein [Duganella sp. FT27W]|uniref:glyoxalase superfamily protein n=1 Tax=Duganella sp. FT27W TaxID=2654636 RepID=UPI00128CBC50|nr:glyoxalase superfamily protein [Duganella sp. FT27W]MPQ56113.1 VOC family protein [Duganella sp. FT27W]
MQIGTVTPLLRVFDEEKARAFYIDYLGFTRDWEHRFEPGMPLYQQVSRGACVLHLTEHHGDCCPGAAIRVTVDDIDALHAELAAKPYRYARPGIEEMPWDSREMSIKDPFGNRLTFVQVADQV